MNVEFLPAAEGELLEAIDFYEGRMSSLGAELLLEVEAVRQFLAEHPQVGVRLDALHRRLALRRFPFAVIFRVAHDVVRVVAFAHKRRKPGYWRSNDR